MHSDRHDGLWATSNLWQHSAYTNSWRGQHAQHSHAVAAWHWQAYSHAGPCAQHSSCCSSPTWICSENMACEFCNQVSTVRGRRSPCEPVAAICNKRYFTSPRQTWLQQTKLRVSSQCQHQQHIAIQYTLAWGIATYSSATISSSLSSPTTVCYTTLSKTCQLLSEGTCNRSNKINEMGSVTFNISQSLW